MSIFTRIFHRRRKTFTPPKVTFSYNPTTNRVSTSSGMSSSEASKVRSAVGASSGISSMSYNPRTNRVSTSGGGGHTYSGGGGSRTTTQPISSLISQPVPEPTVHTAPPTIAAPKPTTAAQLLSKTYANYNQPNQNLNINKNIISSQVGNSAAMKNLAQENYRIQQRRAAEQRRMQQEYNRKVKTMNNYIEKEKKYYQNMYNQGKISYEKANKSLQGAVNILVAGTNKSIQQIAKKNGGIVPLEAAATGQVMPVGGGLILKKSEAEKMGVNVNPYSQYAVVPSNKVGPQTTLGKAKVLWQGSQEMVSAKIPTIEKVAQPISNVISKGISKSRSGWTPKKLETLKKIEKPLSLVGPTGVQIYKSVKEKPLSLAATTAGYALAGPVIGAIGKGGEVVTKAVPFIKPVVTTTKLSAKVGMPLVYGSSVYKRIRAASNPELAWKEYQKKISSGKIKEGEIKLNKEQFYKQYNEQAISKGEEATNILVTELIPMLAGGAAGVKLSSKLFPKEGVPRKAWKALQNSKPDVFLGKQQGNYYQYVVARKTPNLGAISVQEFHVVPGTGQIVKGRGTQEVYDLVNKKLISSSEPFTFSGESYEARLKRIQKNNLLTKRTSLSHPKASAGYLKILTNQNKLIKTPYAGLFENKGKYTRMISGKIPTGRYYKTGKTGLIISPTGPLKYPVYENAIRARFQPTGFGILKVSPEGKIVKFSKPTPSSNVLKVSKIPYAENLVKNLGKANGLSPSTNEGGQIITLKKVSPNVLKGKYAVPSLKVEQKTLGLSKVKLQPIIPNTVGISSLGVKGVSSVPVSSFNKVSPLQNPVSSFNPKIKNMTVSIVKKENAGGGARIVNRRRRISSQIKQFKPALTQPKESAVKIAFIQVASKVQVSKSRKTPANLYINKLSYLQSKVPASIFANAPISGMKTKVQVKAKASSVAAHPYISPISVPVTKAHPSLGVRVNLMKGKSFVPLTRPKPKRQGYTFEIRRKKKWQRANVPYAFATKAGAEAVAQKMVLGEAAASYKIVKASPKKRIVKTRAKISPYRNVLFRPGKEKGVRVQKKLLRILTLGEKRQISYKGALARMRNAKPNYLSLNKNPTQLNLNKGGKQMAKRKKKVGRPKKRKSSRKKRR